MEFYIRGCQIVLDQHGRKGITVMYETPDEFVRLWSIWMHDPEEWMKIRFTDGHSQITFKHGPWNIENVQSEVELVAVELNRNQAPI